MPYQVVSAVERRGVAPNPQGRPAASCVSMQRNNAEQATMWQEKKHKAGRRLLPGWFLVDQVQTRLQFNQIQ